MPSKKKIVKMSSDERRAMAEAAFRRGEMVRYMLCMRSNGSTRDEMPEELRLAWDAHHIGDLTPSQAAAQASARDRRSAIPAPPGWLSGDWDERLANSIRSAMAMAASAARSTDDGGTRCLDDVVIRIPGARLDWVELISAAHGIPLLEGRWFGARCFFLGVGHGYNVQGNARAAAAQAAYEYLVQQELFFVSDAGRKLLRVHLYQQMD